MQSVLKCQSTAALAEDLALACLTCTGVSYASWLLTVSLKPIQASLKRKHEEVSEEKADAIRTRVKVDLDVKEQEEQAKSDAKTQVRLEQLRVAVYGTKVQSFCHRLCFCSQSSSTWVLSTTRVLC